MDLVNLNTQALSQTHYIIDNMLETNKSKIPYQLKDSIYKYMDKDYIFDKEQELFIETRELLYAIIYKYILDDLQKKKANDYLKFYDNKIEERKIGKYEIKFREPTKNTVENNMQLVKVDDRTLLSKIIDKIRNFFIKK